MAKAKVKVKAKKAAVSSGAVTKAKTKRQEIVRDQILKFKDQIDESYLDISKLLTEAYHSNFTEEWGFANFEEYCNKELDWKYRKARYLIDIYDKVKSLQLDEKRVRQLGWSKMKDLAAVLTAKNAKTWLDKAEKMTSREVTEAVKVSRRKDTSNTEVPMVTTVKLTMSESEANIIMEAIAEAKKMTESENDVVALEMICQDWMAEKGATPGRSSIDDVIGYIETVYGVKVSYETVEKSEVEETAEELLDKAEEKDGLDDLNTEEDEDIEDILGLDD